MYLKGGQYMCEDVSAGQSASPLISVLVAIYRVEDYIDECMQSILAQTYQNLDIVLVVSTKDECGAEVAKCSAYAERDSRVRVIVTPPRGLSDARNVGIQAAKGDYIGFVDGDDSVCPDMYEKLFALLQRHQADIASCQAFRNYLDHKDTQVPIQVEVMEPAQAIGAILYQKKIKTSTWDKLYCKELFDGITFPKTKALEDLATTYRIVHKAKRIAVTSEKLYLYKVRSSSLLQTYNEAAEVDIDRILDDLHIYINSHMPAILPAFQSIYVRTLFSQAKGRMEAGLDKQKTKRLLSRCRANAIGVIFDANSRPIAKLVSLFSLLGYTITKVALRAVHTMNKYQPYP